MTRIRTGDKDRIVLVGTVAERIDHDDIMYQKPEARTGPLNLLMLCIPLLLLLLLSGSANGVDGGNPIICVSVPDLPVYAVSIPVENVMHLVADGGRITGYRVRISEAVLCSVSKIPMDWWIKIKPDTEAYQIRAEAGHGISWLDLTDVRAGAFDKFLIIKAVPKEAYSKSKPIKIRIDFSMDIPGERKRKYKTIEEKDMILVPCIGDG